jgi:hypothetical protein
MQLQAHELLRGQSQGVQQNQPQASPESKSTTSAQAPQVPANTLKYKVGDQSYPVFFDGKTHAYLKDGQYIELPPDYKPTPGE